MSSFVKLVAVFSAGLLTVAHGAEKPKGEKTKKPATKQAGDKKSKDSKPDPNGEKTAPKAIDIPVPKGHDAKGLKIPYFSEEGKLQMTFNIGVAKRIDETHVEMSQLQVETYDENGVHEMTMDLPVSVLDLTTSVITAQQAVTIKREDFEITGNTMIFNTKTRAGGLGGRVRMLIYDLDEAGLAPAEPASSQPTPTNPEPQAK